MMVDEGLLVMEMLVTIVHEMVDEIFEYDDSLVVVELLDLHQIQYLYNYLVIYDD